MKSKKAYFPKGNIIAGILFAVLAIVLLLAVFPLYDGVVAALDRETVQNNDLPAQRPCIPGWMKNYDALVNINENFSHIQQQTSPQVYALPYTSILEIPLTEDVFCTYFDKDNSVTRIFVGDYPNDRVLVHNIPPSLMGYSQILDISYGMAWLIDDFDRDGNMDLVLQRGDGTHGYLDIHSAPTWELKTSILLPFMNVYFFPIAVNVDDDAYLEIYLSPSSLWGNEHAMLVQYDPGSDTYVITDNLAAPMGHYGQSAAGDVDGDGNIEIITGNYSGYGLFEYGPGGTPSEYIGLHYKGLISGTNPGGWAEWLRPKPDKLPYIMVGSSHYTSGYTYQLLKATGDNTFQVVQVFNENHGYFGIHPTFALDDDNDGLDEFSMSFHPYTKVYEWNNTLGQFVHIHTWNEIQLGAFVRFAGMDVDQDRRRERGMLNHENLLRFYERQ